MEQLFNSGLSIPSFVNDYTLPRLSDSEQTRFHNLYPELSVVLIAENSMVWNIHLLHIQ